MLRPDTKAPLLKVIKGEGAYLTVSGGRKILDACAGAAVACIGHSDPRVRDAINRQLDAVSYAHSQTYTNEAQEDLAKLLIESTEGAMSHALFMSSGKNFSSSPRG
ncbi:hypothetical protein ACN38_g11262 [Penicillium nordicum]|uniref:Acetylornithine transaminase n=1 Tax=Penicillium nordicum TaxID=229535 RepID=A0A0M8P070_9EURO|nr:hypothetical protein ACN38_g11262 [Penicillium nordicum]